MARQTNQISCNTFHRWHNKIPLVTSDRNLSGLHTRSNQGPQEASDDRYTGQTKDHNNLSRKHTGVGGIVKDGSLAGYD